MATARKHLDSYVDKSTSNADKERIDAFVNRFEKRRLQHLEDLVRNGKLSRSFEMNELTEVD